MSDLISKQDAIDAANEWLLDCLNVQKQDRSCGLIRRLEDLPSVQPEPSQVARDIATIIENEKDMRVIAQSEIKPIDYQDCANAMLRMWMDNVITDGEYNRIMDKLNKFWKTRKEGETE